MMKKIFKLLSLTIAFALAACNDPLDNTVELANDNPLQSFTMVSSGVHYTANIDYATKTFEFPMFTTSGQIDQVICKLLDGATITPDPTAIDYWQKEQVFTVVQGSSRKAFTLSLPNIAEHGELISLGYLPATYGSIDARLSTVPWEYLTHLCVTFLYVQEDGSVNDVDMGNLTRIRDAARAGGVKVLISLSQHEHGDWPDGLSTAENRERAVEQIVDFVIDNDLDGVDVDYEHYSTWNQDFPNTIAFAKLLSEKIKEADPELIMSCATNANYEYTTEWHQYFDYINLMIYDGNGTGRGTPVHHATMENWEWEFSRWLNDFGAPREKLIGGVPFYGYTWDTFSNPDAPLRDSGFAVSVYDIQNQYPDVDVLERTDETGGARIGNSLYNGTYIMKQKCDDIIDQGYGGVMIWQILHDVEGFTLLQTLGESLSIKNDNAK